MLPKYPAVLVTFLVLCCVACQQKANNGAPTSLQSRLDANCAERGKDALNANEKLKRVEAFYSPKINTCVQVEVTDGDKDWSFYLRDVTNGFLRGPKLTKSEQPLTVVVDDNKYLGVALAEGFWQSTESERGKQLVDSIAAKIECNRDNHICRESDASVFIGLIQPDSHEYTISSWTREGIIADDDDEGKCGIGHRLAIDFKSNSVVVTDYPKKVSGDDSCKAFQTANSYALHGGSLAFISVNEIFNCDKDGARSAIIEKVNALHGEVADKTYALWMDNGEGGQPAAVKTPPKPYTQGDCERLMEKKLVELKDQ